jgi:hypothetical protein
MSLILLVVNWFFRDDWSSASGGYAISKYRAGRTGENVVENEVNIESATDEPQILRLRLW